MKTILLGLNELNIDYIKHYVDKGELPNFKTLFDKYKLVKTQSEDKHDLLEPWIQWATVYTGKSYKDHKVFRLGDIVNINHEQIFESLENKGLSVGAVSPFNASNNLRNPKFFIPDPWTKTKVSGSWVTKSLYQAIHQSVNDNATGRLGLRTIISLLLGLILTTPIFNYAWLLKMFFIRKKPGVKAVIFDSILANIFLWLFKHKKPDFSFLFLNSGAHIQHHYLFNSEAYVGEFSNPEWYCPKAYDPLIKTLKLYDDVIGRLFKSDIKLLIATGLHQQPHKKMTYYWRINKLDDFMKSIGVLDYKNILPRMSRDFLVEFSNVKKTSDIEDLLNSFILDRDGEKVFKVDNRGDSLFVELIYNNDILDSDVILSKTNKIELKQFKSLVSFVAIKNGEHNGVGYFLYNPKDYKKKIKQQVELKDIRSIVEEIALN